MFYYCHNTNSPTVVSPNDFLIEEHMFFRRSCALIGLVFVISCEPVKVETESRNFSALEAQRVYINCPCQVAMKQASLFQYSGLCV